MRALVGCLFLVVVGCNEAAVSQSESNSNQVTEVRQFVTTETKFSLGQNCDAVGREGCLDGVCLKVGSERGKGSVCSKSCAGEHKCPSGFGCVQVFPTKDAWFCAPLVDGGVR
jgi:hypothetical protein